MLQKVLFSVVLWKLLTIICIFLGPFFLPLREGYLARDQYGAGLPAVFWSVGNFDGVHYLDIASRGYQLLEQPFFPLYPVVMRLVSEFTGFPILISGLLVSHGAFFGALFVCWKLLRCDGKQALGSLFFGALLLYPTAYHYGAIYNDALFFFLSCLTVYFGRKGNFLWASVSGALAVLARLNGVALFLYLGVEYLLHVAQKDTVSLKKDTILGLVKKALSPHQLRKSGIFWALLLPLAYAGYLGYIHISFGDWQLLHTTMKIWGQDSMVFPLQTMWRYLTILAFHDWWQMNYWVALAELSFVLFYVWVLWYGWGKIRVSYWLLVAFSLSIPALTGSFQGMPRYALHHYAFFLILAYWLGNQKQWVRAVYFIVSIFLFCWFLIQFSRGYFVT